MTQAVAEATQTEPVQPEEAQAARPAAETKAIAVAPAPAPLAAVDTTANAILFDSAKFNQAWRAAKLLASTSLVPPAFKGKTEDCFVACQLAVRLGCDPFMLMQSMYVVHGRPGLEAKFAIALMNTRGPFTGPVQWKFEGTGKDRQCTAFAKHRLTGEVCQTTVTWKMVEAEGWNKKDGSKWLTLPDVMFQYRSAMFLARLYCPEVLMGMQSVDEIQDVGPDVIDVRAVGSRTENLTQRLLGKETTEGAPATGAEKVTPRKAAEGFFGKPTSGDPLSDALEAAPQ